MFASGFLYYEGPDEEFDTLNDRVPANVVFSDFQVLGGMKTDSHRSRIVF